MNYFADIVAALCAPGPLGGLGVGALVGLFLAGLGGGVVHCAPMCGPFVLGQVGMGQVGATLARRPASRLCEMHLLSHALLLPYHLGRLATYAGLGTVAAAAGAGMGKLVWPDGVRAGLLALAALLFLTMALRSVAPAWGRAVPGGDTVFTFIGRMVGRAAYLWRIGGLGGGFLRGVLLGFLPCGMLYATLVIAAATADPLAGALAMLAFGLGTIPALLAVGLAGHAAGRRWARLAARGGAAMQALNAALLGVLAWGVY